MLNWHWLLMAMLAPDNTIMVGGVVVNVPPQAVAEALATVIPLGKVSEKAKPVRAAVLAAGLVIVKVNDEVAFNAMPAGLKAFAIVGGAITFRLADAVPPVPPSVEVMFPVTLLCVPALMPVTLMANAQELLDAMVAPERFTTLLACVAVMVPPPQLPRIPFGVEITNPAGKMSLNVMALSAVAEFVLLIVKLSDVEPFNGTLAAPNALASTGGATTVTAALAVFPVPASFEVLVTELFFTPAVAPVTSKVIAHTVITQEEVAASVPPARLARHHASAVSAPMPWAWGLVLTVINRLGKTHQEIAGCLR
jgi:hypothetical protein